MNTDNQANNLFNFDENLFRSSDAFEQVFDYYFEITFGLWGFILQTLLTDSYDTPPETEFDNLTVSLTPVSDVTVGGLTDFQLMFARQGNDVLYPFDRTLNQPSQPSSQIDFFFGDSEVIKLALLQDLFSILGGEPPSVGKDRFVLGDWQKSYYNDSDITDFAFIFDFNPEQDVIQLHGSSKDYQFVNVPLLGTAIFTVEEENDYFWQGELIGIVFWNFDLQPESSYFKYVEDVPPQAATIEKITQIGTPGIELATAITTDNSGNIYVTGQTNGELGEKNNGSYDPWVAKYDSDGQLLWTKQFGSDKFDSSFSIATDNEGNFIVVGGTQGDLAGPKQAQDDDAWIIKYDQDGNLLWSEQFGTDFLNGATAIDIDDEGNIFLSGLTLKLDPRPEDDPNRIVDVQDDFWVKKYDSNGNQVWFTEVSSDLTSFALWEEAYDIALSPDGSIYASGWTYADFTGGGEFNFYDAWVSKFNENGELEWIQQFGTEEFEFSWGVDTDSEGNVYAYGWTDGNLVEENDSYDVWLTKFLPDGTQEWIKQFGTSSDDGVLLGGLEIDANDNIFISGYTNGDFGATNAGSYDAWLGRYDTDGNQIWVQQFGSTEVDYATDITSDDYGNLYISGFTEGSLGDNNAGAIDAWVAKLDADSGELEYFNKSKETAADIPDKPEPKITPQTPISLPMLTLKKGENDLLAIEGDPEKLALKFNIEYSKISSKHEIGVFAVDDKNGGIDLDDNGTIDINPGDEKYIETALSRGMVLFSNLPDMGLKQEEIIQGFNGNHLAFYLVQNSSTDAVLAGKTSVTDVLMAPRGFNANQIDSVDIFNSDSEKFLLSWEEEIDGGDGNYGDLVVGIEVLENTEVLDSLVLGKSEIIDLRNLAPGQVRAEIKSTGDAAYQNKAGLYIISDTDGRVYDPLTNQYFTPGQTGYREAALAQSVIEFEKDSEKSVALTSGLMYAPYVAIDGDKNQVFFSFLEANSDGEDHILKLGNNMFGIEDLPSLGDADYNDLIFEVDLSTIA